MGEFHKPMMRFYPIIKYKNNAHLWTIFTFIFMTIMQLFLWNNAEIVTVLIYNLCIFYAVYIYVQSFFWKYYPCPTLWDMWHLAVCFQDCIICMERLSCPSGYEVPAECSQSLQPNTVGKLTKCGHTFHMLCMLAMYNNGTKVCNTLPTQIWELIK